MDDLSYLQNAVYDVLRDLERYEHSNGERDLQLMIGKVDYLRRIVVNLEIDDLVANFINEAYRSLLEMERSNQHGGYQASKQETERGRRGRPPFDISKEQLSYFIDNGFKIKDISSMLGVSVRTVERRISSFGLSISGKKLYLYIIITSLITINMKFT